MTEVPRPRLVGWVILVTGLAALSYAAHFAGGEPADDVLYEWATAAAALVQYGIILAIVLALARGIAPATLGLRRPQSWGRAAGWILASLAAIWILGAILNIFLKAGEEQGLVPDGWDASRAAPFVANFLVIAIVAPFVEELTYRGLGFAAVASAYGPIAAIVVTSLAFGLAHGLVVALPVLTIFGAILAWLRFKTKSIYPTVILHGLFNGAALIAAVST